MRLSGGAMRHATQGEQCREARWLAKWKSRNWLNMCIICWMSMLISKQRGCAVDVRTSIQVMAVEAPF
jgi:hypothetical protein